MGMEDTAQGLIGCTIKEVFNHAEEIAELHACLTSPRGDHFRIRLLQALEVPMDGDDLERIKEGSAVHEYHRHLHKLLEMGLVLDKEVDGRRRYIRTDLGEKAINSVRELERGISPQDAEAIDAAALGPNSIRFFLRVYGNKAEVNWDHGEVYYTPAEVGKLSLFLPRAIEGVSAMDKLGEAGLMVYRDDGNIHVPPVKARSFYRYLRRLYGIVSANAGRSGHRRYRE